MERGWMQKLAGIMGVLTWSLLASSGSQAQTLAVEPYEHRPAIQNAIVEERLEKLLPGLMREAGVDMWLVPSSQRDL